MSSVRLNACLWAALTLCLAIQAITFHSSTRSGRSRVFEPSSNKEQDFFLLVSSHASNLSEVFRTVRFSNSERIRSLRSGSYFVAVVFGGSSENIPQWGQELLKTIAVLGNKGLSNVFVSVYASGSTDASRTPLHSLKTAFEELSIEHSFIYEGRRDGSQRESVHRGRNRALSPLLAGQVQAEHIIFSEAVLFHASGLLELVAEARLNQDSDLACSVDYITELQDGLQLYDQEVLQDIEGRSFVSGPPYVLHNQSAKAFLAGVPFQVFACWGGLVVIKADLLGSKLGLRFRTARQLDCPAFAAELFCQDLWTANRTRIVMVPSVTTARNNATFRKVPRHLRASTLIRFQSKPPSAPECCLPAERASAFKPTRCYENLLFAVVPQISGYKIAGSLSTVDDVVSLLRTDRQERCQGDVRTQLEAYVIPAELVQMGRSRDTRALRWLALQGLVMWLWVHPCHNYTLLTDPDIDAFVGAHFPEYAPLFSSLANGAERTDFARYLYLYVHGGFYADTDTSPKRSVTESFGPGDMLVVGLEASFPTAFQAFAWRYARQRAASLHAFATVPGHPVLKEVIEQVVQNIRQPWRVLEQVMLRRLGGPAQLVTVFKTGPGVFSDVTLQSEGVRILGVHAYTAGHGSPNIYAAMLPADVRDKAEFVVHYNFGSWSKVCFGLPINFRFDYLQKNRVMKEGHWMLAYEGPDIPVEPIMRSPKVSVVPLNRSRNLTLLFVVVRGGAPTILLGEGPHDPDAQLLWRPELLRPVTNGADAGLVLQDDGNVVAYEFAQTGGFFESTCRDARTALWSFGTGTAEVQATFMVLGRDGRLALYRGSSPGDTFPMTHAWKPSKLYPGRVQHLSSLLEGEFMSPNQVMGSAGSGSHLYLSTNRSLCVYTNGSEVPIRCYRLNGGVDAGQIFLLAKSGLQACLHEGLEEPTKEVCCVAAQLCPESTVEFVHPALSLSADGDLYWTGSNKKCVLPPFPASCVSIELF